MTIPIILRLQVPFIFLAILQLIILVILQSLWLLPLQNPHLRTFRPFSGSCLRRLQREVWPTDKSHSFTVGAFSKVGRVGVRANTRSFPAVTQMLTRFVRSRDPDRVFGAIACFTNLEADFHSDVNNDARFHNWIVPLSRFKQGGIWVEQEGGPVTKFARGRNRHGAILDVCAGPVELPSHCLHCVLPWTGTRCVLVAFVPASLEPLETN